MLTFCIRAGILSSDSVMLVNGRVVDKRQAVCEDTKPGKRQKNVHHFCVKKKIAFNIPPSPSPASSCSTDLPNMEEPCMLCGFPEDEPTDKMCKLCADLLDEGLADVVTVPAALFE